MTGACKNTWDQVNQHHAPRTHAQQNAPAGEEVELAGHGGGLTEGAALRGGEGEVAVLELLQCPVDLGGGLARLGHLGLEALW